MYVGHFEKFSAGAATPHLNVPVMPLLYLHATLQSLLPRSLFTSQHLLISDHESQGCCRQPRAPASQSARQQQEQASQDPPPGESGWCGPLHEWRPTQRRTMPPCPPAACRSAGSCGNQWTHPHGPRPTRPTLRRRTVFPKRRRRRARPKPSRRTPSAHCTSSRCRRRDRTCSLTRSMRVSVPRAAQQPQMGSTRQPRMGARGLLPPPRARGPLHMFRDSCSPLICSGAPAAPEAWHTSSSLPRRWSADLNPQG